MATPPYLGAAQPLPSRGDGLIARIGAYLGSETPVYRGAGQPAPSMTAALLRTSTPFYAAAPIRDQSVEPVAEMHADGDEQMSTCQAGCPIDAEALASGHIAIVIPRGT